MALLTPTQSLAANEERSGTPVAFNVATVAP